MKAFSRICLNVLLLPVLSANLKRKQLAVELQKYRNTFIYNKTSLRPINFSLSKLITVSQTNVARPRELHFPKRTLQPQ